MIAKRSSSLLSLVLLFLLGLLAAFRVFPAVQMNRSSLDVLSGLNLQEAPRNGLELFLHSYRCNETLQEKLPLDNLPDQVFSDEIPIGSVALLLCGWADGNDFSLSSSAARTARINWYLGRSNFLRGQIDEAIQYWSQVANADLFFARMGANIYWSGQGESDNGHKEAALTYLNLAEDINPRVVPKKADAYKALYRIYRQPPFRDEEKLLRYAQQLLEVDRVPSNYLIVANSLIAQEKFSAAEELIHRLRRDFPDNSDAYYPLGRAYLGQGNLIEACHAFQLVPQMSSNLPLAQAEMVGILLSQDRTEEAEELARQVTESGNERANRRLKDLISLDDSRQ